MPRRLGFATAVALLLLGSPNTASADWLITPFLGATFKGQTNFAAVDQAARLTHFTFGGNTMLIGSGLLGLEIDFGRSPGFFERFERDDDRSLVTASSATTLVGNVVLAAPLAMTGDSLRPYFSGGAGWMRAQIDYDLNVFAVDASLLALNAGGGAIGFLSDNVGLRWDLRYFWSVADRNDPNSISLGEHQLGFWRGTMGVVLRR